MPRVPSPSSTAFGGGAYAQAQFQAAAALGQVGRSIGQLGQSLREAENRQKFREDAILRVGDLQQFRLDLDNDYNAWADEKHYDPQTLEDLRARVQERAKSFIAPGRYQLPQSAQQFEAEANALASDALLKGQRAIRDNGKELVARSINSYVAQQADRVRFNPSAIQPALQAVREVYEREGSVLEGAEGELYQTHVQELTREAVGAALRVSGSAEMAHQILNMPEVMQVSDVRFRSDMWTQVDKFREDRLALDAQADIKTADLNHKRAQTAHRLAQIEGTRLDNEAKAFELQWTKEEREPTQQEAAELAKLQAEAKRQKSEAERTAAQIDFHRVKSLVARDEYERKQRGELREHHKDVQESERFRQDHAQEFSQGSRPYQETVMSMLGLAQKTMSKYPNAADQQVAPPGYNQALEPILGVSLERYFSDNQAREEADRRIAELPSRDGMANDVGRRMAQEEGAVAPQTTAASQTAATPGVQGPTPAETAPQPAPVAMKPSVLNKAREIEQEDGDPSPEEADKNINALVAEGLDVYSNVDLTYGPGNRLKTAVFNTWGGEHIVGNQEARAQAQESINAAKRMIMAAVDYPGRFSDSYREWIMSEVPSLQPGWTDNPESVKAQLETFAGVLARSFFSQYKKQQSALSGDSTAEPGAQVKATERMGAIKSMFKALGAPVLLGLDPVSGETPELDAKTSEELANTIDTLINIGFLEVGDKFKFGGRIGTVTEEDANDG